MGDKFRFQLWLVLRFLVTGGRFLNVTSALALFGMVLGVACLVLTMAAVSGFESALKSAVIDVSGHLMLVKAGGGAEAPKEMIPKFKEVISDFVAATPFVHLEAIAARPGRIQGVIVQGMDPETIDTVLNLRTRIVRGTYGFAAPGGVPTVIAGKVFVEKLGLNIGDEFQIVVPKPSREEETSFRPTSRKFRLGGVADFGKYEYDQRLVIMDVHEAQVLADIGDRYTGYKIRVSSPDTASAASHALSAKLGYPHWTKDWTEVNQNLFKAIKLEKVVLFIVVLFMVIAAAFNISSSLFVNVLKRYRDVAILKTMGAPPSFLVNLFAMQGLVIGAVGSALGVALGIVLCYVLVNSALFQIPGEIYRLDHLPIEVRPLDLSVILLVSFVICFLSTLAPALRGSTFKPVEGLRYE